LVAFTNAEYHAGVGPWAPTVLLLAMALAVGAALWGSVLRRRRRYLWSGFGFGLPILPLALTLAVLADVYL